MAHFTADELTISGLFFIDNEGDYTIARDPVTDRYQVPGDCADGYLRAIGDTFKHVSEAREYARKLTERNKRELS